MRTYSHSQPPTTVPQPLAAQRHGFTLTEMLVATAITLIILLIFAQVFRSATQTIGIQRGIGQNDARARMFNTIIRSDLQKATFRDHPASTSRGLLTLGIHDVNELGFEPVHRDQAGYWYVSENDPTNDIDDVLQFTIGVEEVQRNKESHPYVGKASQIGRPASASVGAGTFNPQAAAGNPDQNQPEFDDGNNGNGATQSRFAEVCLFVRNGTLYRRVMLLRDPLAIQAPGYDEQPDYYEQNPLPGSRQPLLPGDYNASADVDANSTPGVLDFWHDFDVAAFHEDPAATAPNPAPVILAGKDDLANSRYASGQPYDSPLLANPKRRFGFKYRSDLTAAYALNANSVEYVSNGSTFIGRFTQEETSHPGFDWPGSFNAVNNPLVQTDLALVNGVVHDVSRSLTFQDGPRRGEDILLTNVDAFDVKLFEIDTASTTGLGQFVDVGHSGVGVLSANARRNPDYGPRTPTATVANNIFDTWHPGNIYYGRPPFRPVYSNPLAAADNNVANATYNPRYPVTRTSWDWQGNTQYDIRNSTTGTPGSRIYPFPLTTADVGGDGKPGVADMDDDMDGSIDNRSELGWGGSDDVAGLYDGLYYEAVDYGGSGTPTSAPATQEPTWLKRYGHRVVDNGILWQCFDNRVGVSLIQITIRYRDPASNLSRQVTIQHSLTDRSE